MKTLTALKINLGLILAITGDTLSSTPVSVSSDFNITLDKIAYILGIIASIFGMYMQATKNKGGQ